MLNGSRLPVLPDTTQQPKYKKMKNVKLNIRKIAKAGFSLVEMLVVIAVIGVIAAIAIPNIGNVNDAARQAAAKRNAQNIASVFNSGLAAGVNWAATDVDTAVTNVLAGKTATDGAFSGKTFKVGAIPTDDVPRLKSYLRWDSDTATLAYTQTAATP